MYYTVAVTSVSCIIALGLRTSYRQLSGAASSADGNSTMVNGDSETYVLNRVFGKRM
jgi:hypothetical protein